MTLETPQNMPFRFLSECGVRAFCLRSHALRIGIALLLTFCGLQTVLAEQVVLQTTLKDLGEKEPVRIEGPVNEQNFFFPLPVRIFEPQAAFVELKLRASARIAEACNIEVFANDILIAQQLINPSERITITAPLTPMEPYKLGEDFIKISVRVSLRRPNLFDRCEDLITRELWVEVDPTSRFGTRFDATNPDWLSVSRLPSTLQRSITIDVQSDAGMVERDLALKLTSWIAYISPRLHWLTSEIGAGDFGGEGTGRDEFVIKAVEGGGFPGIRVEANGLNRRITLSASTSAQAREIWGLLREMDRARLPGRSWSIQEGVGPAAAMPTRNFYAISQLEPTFLDFVAGIGQLDRTFGFDTALFAEGDVSLHLHVEGRHTPVVREGSALLAVYVNDRLAYTEELKVGSDKINIDVPLTAEYLQEENEVRFSISYFPTSEECRNPLFFFGYQLNDNSSLSLVSAGAAPTNIFDLVRVARRFFGRGKYQVATAEGSPEAYWKTAVYAVQWIQKMNLRRLCEPEYISQLAQTGESPTLLIGFGGNQIDGLEGRRIIPVERSGGVFDLKSREGSNLFTLESATSAGFWQMAYNRAKKPVFLLDAWGAGGTGALLTLVTQMADLPWMGRGDLVVGDGQTPAYSFASADLEIRSGNVVLGQTESFWQSIRWWLIIPLWILISILMVWILRQALARKRS